MVELLEVQKKETQIKNSVTEQNKISVENFVKALKTAEEEKWSIKNIIEAWKDIIWTATNHKNYKERVIDAFDDKGKIILENIKKNIQDNLNAANRDQKTISINEALQAFTTDINKYSLEWPSNILSDDLTLIEEIKTTIKNKQEEIEKEKNKEETIDNILNTNRTTETAKNFFEQPHNEDAFNIVFDYIKGITDKDANTSTATEKKQIVNFENLIKIYAEDKSISEIKLETIGDGWIYTAGTRKITYTKWEEGKEIVFWSQDKMQSKRAENAPLTEINLAIEEEPLLQFNNKGNYRLFEKYIKLNPEPFKDNFKNIVDNILKYKKPTNTKELDSGEDEDGLRNGYANVLTDYMSQSTDIVLLKTYLSYITTDKLNILWVDEMTRKNNYNKIFFSDPEKWIYRPEIMKLMPTLKNNEKKKLLESITTVKESLDPTNNWSAKEKFKKWFDSLIDTFGPMLFNILKYLGIGKATLRERFPWAAEKIDEVFQKEYKLSDEQRKAITEISKDERIINNEDRKDKRLEKAEDMKDMFGDNTTKYINILIPKKNDNTYDYTYIKYIDINTLQAWLDIYNKKSKQNLNINDIVTIEEDKTTKKKSITNIKEGQDDAFKTILTALLEDDAIRNRVASANAQIQAPRNDEDTWHNEQGLVLGENQDAKRYLIQNNHDVARYLTAALFSGKDLDYTMTENSLHNWTKIKNKQIEDNETDKKTLTFIDKNKYFTNGELNPEWYKKTIHEVIDVSKSPEKLQIIRANWTIVPIEQKKIGDILTYVEVGQSTKVTINIWDQIQEMPAVTTTPAENPQNIAEELWLAYNTNTKTYTYVTLNNQEISSTETAKDQLKSRKEAALKADLAIIEKEKVTYAFNNYEYIFLKADKTPSAFSLLVDDVTSNKEKIYGNILNQTNIKSFLNDIKTKNNEANGKYLGKFNIDKGSDIDNALVNIEKIINSYKVEKNSDGNIKISGKDAGWTEMSFVLKANLENFKAVTA